MASRKQDNHLVSSADDDRLSDFTYTYIYVYNTQQKLTRNNKSRQEQCKRQEIKKGRLLLGVVVSRLFISSPYPPYTRLSVVKERRYVTM